jgi:hypothetical protein
MTLFSSGLFHPYERNTSTIYSSSKPMQKQPGTKKIPKAILKLVDFYHLQTELMKPVLDTDQEHYHCDLIGSLRSVSSLQLIPVSIKCF